MFISVKPDKVLLNKVVGFAFGLAMRLALTQHKL